MLTNTLQCLLTQPKNQLTFLIIFYIFHKSCIKFFLKLYINNCSKDIRKYNRFYNGEKKWKWWVGVKIQTIRHSIWIIVKMSMKLLYHRWTLCLFPLTELCLWSVKSLLSGAQGISLGRKGISVYDTGKCLIREAWISNQALKLHSVLLHSLPHYTTHRHHPTKLTGSFF